MDRMKELIDILNEAAKAYYQEDRQIMSDHEYDALYDELVKLENESGIVYGGSPTPESRIYGFELPAKGQAR